MDIKIYIENKKKIIDRALDRYLPASKERPQIIHMAMRYAVFPGGKRIRPIFAIAGFEACGGKGDSIMPVACAIELVHSYTLVHDDLPCMDDDDLRRGRKTCHKKFGEDMALLAGDGLLTLAFNVLARTGNIEVIQEISKAIGTYGVIGGQVIDIKNQKLPLDYARGRKIKDQKRTINYINAKKTASLFEAAAKSGGILKGAAQKEINALANFGRDIGLTFQLMDDLNDKDGYVNIYGVNYTKKRVESLAIRAKGHLKVFGKKARNLSGLAGLISNLTSY